MESLIDRRHGAANRRGVTLTRRSVLGCAAAAATHWLTPVAERLARAAELQPRGEPAQSVILLWMQGGPSQLETFDPHPGTSAAAGTGAIDTAVPGIQLAEGYPLLAEQMRSISLVRSMVSKEGDHARGTYLAKTGYRPTPTVVHPSIGAICCHRLPAGGAEIPRHVSILPSQWPARGGYLGDAYDAFQTGDPRQPVPDVTARVSDERYRRRLSNLDVVERAFARGRGAQVERTLHGETLEQARLMMGSAQLAAFDVSDEPAALLAGYGDTPFGRGCLAARRLIDVGVRCVEVTLEGWDSHVKNHARHREQAGVLDPAFAALVADLRERGLLDRTVVLCMGEFGRTPRLNPLDGRDHWPHGFSVALAGGGIAGGRVLGTTDAEGARDGKDPAAGVDDPRTFADVHATVLKAVGIDPAEKFVSPVGRPIAWSEGEPMAELLAAD